jgi:hypothetical protein
LSTTYKCTYCDELILPDDPGEASFIHRECAVRAVAGSVGHQLGTCSCHGGTDEDPPGLTKREAARQALQLYVDMSAVKERYRALFITSVSTTQ